MSTTFEKKQIVSSTDLVRFFAKYVERDLEDHDLFIFKRNQPEAVLVSYDRYEKLEKELEKLREILEHLMIYEMVQERKDGEEEEISIEELQKKYGL